MNAPISAPNHVTEIFQNQIEKWAWGRIASLGIGVALLSAVGLLLTPRENYAAKTAIATSGIVSLNGTGYAASRLQNRKRRVQRADDMSDAGYVQELYEQLVNPNRERPVLEASNENYEPPLYNIYDLVNPARYNTYAHFIILGKTGSGKSTLVAELMRRCEGHKYYVSPNREEDEFIGDFHYVGCGSLPHHNGNYEAIQRFFVENRKEQITRSKLGKIQKFALGRMEIAVDEVPLIGRNVSSWTDWFIDTVSAARKQGIRLWLLATGEQVKTLKLEGSGDMKDNLNYLWIGEEYVEEELKKLVDAKVYPRAVMDWFYGQVERGNRVFLFGKKLGIIPDLGGVSFTTQTVSTSTEPEVTSSNPFELEENEVLVEDSSLVLLTPYTEPNSSGFNLESGIENEGSESIDDLESSLTPEERAYRAIWMEKLKAGQRKQRILFASGFCGTKEKWAQGAAIWAKVFPE